MSYIEYIHSAQLGEFFWFLAALIILILSLVKIFVFEDKMLFEENKSMIGSLSRMGTKGIEYQLTINNEPMDEKVNTKEGVQTQKSDVRKQTEHLQPVEPEGLVMDINQISPNKNSRYYSPNGKDLREDLDAEHVDPNRITPAKERKLNKLSSPIVKDNKFESNSFIDFESYVDKPKSPKKSPSQKLEGSTEKKLKEANESLEIVRKKSDNIAEVRNRNSPNPKSVSLTVNGTPVRGGGGGEGGAKAQIFEVKSVQGASASEIKDDQKSVSLKEISLGVQAVEGRAGEGRPKRDDKVQRGKTIVKGTEEMLFKFFPLLNLFILNVTTQASYPFSAFIVMFYLLWVGVLEVGKVLTRTKFQYLQDYTEIGSKTLILILFINYFSADQSKY